MSGKAIHLDAAATQQIPFRSATPDRRSPSTPGLWHLLLPFAELCAVGAAAVIACGLALLVGLDAGPVAMMVLGFSAGVVALPLSRLFGLFDAAGYDELERFRTRVVVDCMLPWPGMVALALLNSLTPAAVVLSLGMGAIFLPVSMVTEALARRRLIELGAWGSNVVVIGDGAAASRIAADLMRRPEIGLRPVALSGMPPADGTAPPVPLVAQPGDAMALAEPATMAVVLLSGQQPQIDLMQLPFDRIVVMPVDGGIPAVAVRTRALGGAAGFCFANPARARSHQRAKRLLDLLVAVPALIVVLPLIGLFALAIRIIDPGPIFYTQARVGWRGETVRILKLRSMYADAEARLEDMLRRDPAARREWETYIKLQNDPRILPWIGTFMRRSSIDELPQLWNVVRGDISLVGPRPFPRYHVERFSPEFQALRASVRPGLTGLWQVSDRSSADLARQETIDSFYIQNWSLWLDFYIVFRTLPAVLAARGAR